MRKTVELKKLIDAQRTKVDGLYKAEQFSDAVKEAQILNSMMEEYHIAEAMERATFQGAFHEIGKTSNADSKKMHNRVFNKLVLGDKFSYPALTDEEKEYAETLDAAGTPGQVGATPSKGGYLIPTEQMARIIEFRRAYAQLKNYCNVQTAGSRTGTQPTIGSEHGELTNFEELKDINVSDIDFGQISYSIKDYGDIIPVANQLLQDIDVNLVDIIGQRFARKAVNTENKAIVNLLKTLTPTAYDSYKGINTVLNTVLDTAISANATIFTNQSGYDFLDQLEDAEKRPLLMADVTAPGQYRYRGRPIVVLNDTILTSTTGTVPFLIGSMTDYATFFDRVGIEMAISTEALFVKYATAIRAVERFDVQKVDEKAMVMATVKTTTV
jgi:HK97 family phage major capsid protein